MSMLAEHMASGCTTVCRAWIVRRKDGLTLGFTDHDLELIVEGVACLAASGMTAGALQASTGLAVDNAEAQGALSHDAIRGEDIRAGLWDGAEVTSYLVNWQSAQDFEVLFRGSLGEISWGEGAFTAELRGLSETLNKARGRVYQSRCDAALGDERCRHELGPMFTTEVEVSASSDDRLVMLPLLRDFPPKWFENGQLIVLSGAAQGALERIKTDRTREEVRELGLWQSLRRAIEPGDRVKINAGCDKRMSTCRLKFDNLLNFRGFPQIPGEDWLLTYPVSGGGNDGGKL
ncbi:phage conserved hypothetical protein BR0599 [Jannaschia faecimaris]|uniref:Bacteriophage phiJL001 Gp84 C-terminal domain-containing protein n=1 Tax=Jannaschia faecimaris TaxID=1244108 RepID=A0A1H3S099_9RHOB|nr:DUF2163 domain-containing protein [Jannaschia faecimaris]SDZ30911.1 phage conserved hypothetical protein BR0599 [Jannaschia faecimaris]